MSKSHPDEKGPTKPKRRRNPEASRAAILKAAAEVFGERGYDRATIREIARRAGVTHGLVIRHFHNKEELLIAAFPGPRDVAPLVSGSTETLPERIADGFVAGLDATGNSHPIIALIRCAAAGESSAAQLYEAIEEQVMSSYGQIFDAPEAEVRVHLMAATLIGVAFYRRVLASGPLAQLDADALVAELGRALRGLLEPVLAG